MRLMIALIAVITASSATAAPGPGTATLTSPVQSAMVITDAGMWHCAGTSCTGTASGSLRVAVAVCSAVAEAAGRVAAFSAAGYSFTDADLARCNRRVKA